ncbi:MAG: hypothetical protein OXQ29_06570 [Rhodospirillaceae bacterium]|nr:hypothetical protein [Rhodospirillaceae bacterium]
MAGVTTDQVADRKYRVEILVPDEAGTPEQWIVDLARFRIRDYELIHQFDHPTPEKSATEALAVLWPQIALRVVRDGEEIDAGDVPFEVATEVYLAHPSFRPRR